MACIQQEWLCHKYIMLSSILQLKTIPDAFYQHSLHCLYEVALIDLNVAF